MVVRRRWSGSSAPPCEAVARADRRARAERHGGWWASCTARSRRRSPWLGGRFCASMKNARLEPSARTYDDADAFCCPGSGELQRRAAASIVGPVSVTVVAVWLAVVAGRLFAARAAASRQDHRDDHGRDDHRQQQRAADARAALARSERALGRAPRAAPAARRRRGQIADALRRARGGGACAGCADRRGSPAARARASGASSCGDRLRPRRVPARSCSGRCACAGARRRPAAGRAGSRRPPRGARAVSSRAWRGASSASAACARSWTARSAMPSSAATSA